MAKHKRQQTEQENIFVNNIFNKANIQRLISKISNISYNSVSKTSDFKMGRRPEKIFFQGRHTDGQPIWEKNTQHH